MSDALMPTYARADLAFESGEGPYVIGDDGRRYLDFGAGIAVNALGYAHPHLVEALTRQGCRVWHCSNLFRIPEGERLAERLCAASFAERVFFCNSGAEAMECAIKLVRKYHSDGGTPERHTIIAVEGAFHGRTLSTLAAAGNAKHLAGFDPQMPGFTQVPFGDKEALEAAIGPDTAAILVEPIQGESGIRPIDRDMLRSLREICDKHGLLLVFDEIQCGMGRTGRLFAHELADVVPDVMTLAKGLGGGFPVGACLATAEASRGLTPGTHGSTFGGNPLAMAVANAVLDVMLEDGFLASVERHGRILGEGLERLIAQHPEVLGQLRGYGLMRGLRAIVPNGELVARLRGEGLLTVPAGDNVVRILPPLIIDDSHIAEALDIMGRVCAGWAKAA